MSDTHLKELLIGSQFHQYTTLNAPRVKILKEALNDELIHLREGGHP